MINKKFLLRLIRHIYAKTSPTYHRTIRLLQSTEYLSEESLQQLQFRHLKNMLVHAFEKSHYYRETFHQAGVDPHDMIELDDIQAFPLLTKQQYRDNLDKIMSKDAKKPFLIHMYTGGTTGTPLPLYRQLNDFARQEAFVDYMYLMMGADPFCKTVYLRGEVGDKKGIYHYVGNFGKILYLSSHNMTDRNLELYIKLIRDYKPRLMYALPSVAMILAGYLERNHIAPFAGLRWAICPSENLYEFQIKYIQKVLQCQVHNFYGHGEHAVLASGCTKSTRYHVLPQYGYAELIDEDGNLVTQEGGLGEIVATSFTNPCCPFIRYRTGDYAVYTAKKCPCGRNYTMWEKIEGRVQAVAIAKNGGRISIGPDLLCTIFDRTYMKIKQFKIEQRRVGELTFRVIPHKNSDIIEIRQFFKRIFNEQFPGSFDVKVERLEESDLDQRDKHLYFIQHVECKDTALNE